MVSNSILRLFLMLSILVIMAGILLIIYMQFDRGYVFIGLDPEFEREQQNLISHVYQNQLQAKSTPVVPVIEPRRTVMLVDPAPRQAPPPVIRPEPSAQAPISRPVSPSTSTPALPGTTDEPATPRRAETAPVEPAEDYYSLLLRHNPWSPHFKPGQQ